MGILLLSILKEMFILGELGKILIYIHKYSACGQLGLSSMKDLPTDIEGYPYQPTPRIVELLCNIRVVQIACGDAHTVALSRDGKLYSWGGGGCG